MNWRWRGPLAREGRHVVTLHNRFIEVVLIGPEAIHDPAVATPGMEVGKQRVVDAVRQTRIRQRHALAHDGLHRRPRTRRHHRARRHALWHSAERRLIEIAHRHRIKHLLFGRCCAQMRARRRIGRNRAREISPGIVLRIFIANANENLRVRVNDVEGLHESFLTRLPIARHDLGNMGLDIALLW